MADVPRSGGDEIARPCEGLEDPRSTVNRRHPVVRVVVLALMAVLAGADGPTAIAEGAALKAGCLREVRDLPNGIPCKDAVRRVRMRRKPAAFQAGVAAWLQSWRATAAAAAGVEQPILSVEGTTARRRHDRRKGWGALPCVRVGARAFGLSLGQVACAAKSNAITAIPELLRLVDLPGAILTRDAMGAQEASAAEIIDGEGDEVLAWKGHQESRHPAVIAHIDEPLEGDLEGAQEHVTIEQGPGRAETRTSLQLPAPESLPGFAPWKGLQSIGVATSGCRREGTETLEVRDAISSLPGSVKEFAPAVRGPWGIEQSCHWSLEITDREDESRIRDRHLRENVAWLRRITLSLLKQHQSRKRVAMGRNCGGWSEDFMLEVLTGATI